MGSAKVMLPWEHVSTRGDTAKVGTVRPFHRLHTGTVVLYVAPLQPSLSQENRLVRTSYCSHCVNTTRAGNSCSSMLGTGNGVILEACISLASSLKE